MPPDVKSMPIGHVVDYKNSTITRTSTSYIGVVQGEKSIVGDIVTMLISTRKNVIAKGDDIADAESKFLVNARYGSMASGILSSKTFNEATTCTARYFLKVMVKAREGTRATVIYGGTDSVVAEVGAANE
ncbi:hypothetical protein K458DRAFT_409456 [Lentithecium fluviatile CBS 122367]|uniref:Uncharacterized protein n=1 Tax=Lentithecium fluviatile CBS 122367 TaxID=1168545 RepID=A0A6G1IHN5_9PLEO|nr:hypothetical protein K458DRAFT_409456 [Lentithecium fluviatile CBS 122367]